MQKRTPLYKKHSELKAKFVNFAGWEMPLSYSSVIEEHISVREKAGLFDIGHMGIIDVEGSNSKEFLQYVTTNDVSKLNIFDAQYSFLCDQDGQVIDDIFIYKMKDSFMIIANAVNAERVISWLKTFSVKNLKINLNYEKKGILSIQGPKAKTILSKLCNIDLSKLKHNKGSFLSISDVPCFISRTGYTGEDGFEIFFEIKDAETLWDIILKEGKDDGLIPCGLGARDSLRIEAGLPLYGNEYTKETGPIEVGYLWAVKFEKGNFLGRDALLKKKENLRQKLLGIKLKDGPILRSGYEIFLDKEMKIKLGYISSGTYSPILKTSIGLAFIKKEYDNIGASVYVKIREKPFLAEACSLPFIKHNFYK